jgi:predicted outer membrane protein
MHEQRSYRHISAEIDLNGGMKLRLLTSALSIAALSLAVPACKKKESAPPATTGSDMAGSAGSADMAGSAGSADMAGSGSAAAAASLTDPQIAAIVVAANQVDIDAGNLAAKKTKNPEVKKFAELMVKDHTAVNKSAVDLVTKLKVTPEESETSKTLKTGGAENVARLEKLEGA